MGYILQINTKMLSFATKEGKLQVDEMKREGKLYVDKNGEYDVVQKARVFKSFEQADQFRAITEVVIKQ